jgi:hypothetical protein
VVHNSEEKQDWFGFCNIQVQKGLFPDVRLIPLHGHTQGHCGVAIETSKEWLLHCGDAMYPFCQENKQVAPISPLPLYMVSPPKWLEKSLVGEHTPRLRKLYEEHNDVIQFICANDPISYSLQRYG